MSDYSSLKCFGWDSVFINILASLLWVELIQYTTGLFLERRTAWGTYRPMSLGDLPDNPDKANPALQYSDKVIAALQKELEIEQRIVEAARRMAELPTSSKKERTKRRQSLQQ